MWRPTGAQARVMSLSGRDSSRIVMVFSFLDHFIPSLFSSSFLLFPLLFFSSEIIWRVHWHWQDDSMWKRQTQGLQCSSTFSPLLFFPLFFPLSGDPTSKDRQFDSPRSPRSPSILSLLASSFCLLFVAACFLIFLFFAVLFFCFFLFFVFFWFHFF